MHCMLMDLLHGFEVLSTTEETLFNSRNVSRLVQNNLIYIATDHTRWHQMTFMHQLKIQSFKTKPLGSNMDIKCE